MLQILPNHFGDRGQRFGYRGSGAIERARAGVAASVSDHKGGAVNRQIEAVGNGLPGK